MAGAEDRLDFLADGIGMFFDKGRKFFEVELAPLPPNSFPGRACRVGRRPDSDKRNSAPTQIAGRPRLWRRRPGESSPPLPQVQRIGFPARKPSSLCPNVNMKCYRSTALRQVGQPALLRGSARMLPGGSLSSTTRSLSPTCPYLPHAPAVRLIRAARDSGPPGGGEAGTRIPRMTTDSIGAIRCNSCQFQITARKDARLLDANFCRILQWFGFYRL